MPSTLLHINLLSPRISSQPQQRQHKHFLLSEEQEPECPLHPTTMPNTYLQTRNSCDHPLTSDDIENGRFCAPIHQCIHCQAWFPIVLVFIIIFVLIFTCCCVKKLRPTPWKEGYFAHGFLKRGSSYDKPARISRSGGSGGEKGRMPPADRVWPGTEMGMGRVSPRPPVGGRSERPQRSEAGGREGSMPVDFGIAPARSHSSRRGAGGGRGVYATRQ